MRKIIFLILISLAVPAFAVDLLLNKSDGDIWYASDVNSILNHLDGVLYPISPSTRNKIDDTCDLGSGTYRWKNAYFSGDLTVDTNTLYVDSANNRVGIGTTSPLPSPWTALKGLHISSSQPTGLLVEGTSAYFQLRDSDATTNQKMFEILNANQKVQVRALDDTLTQTYNLTTYDLSNGNVGIGTTSPSAKLSISAMGGNGTSGEFIRLNRSTDENRYHSLFAGNDATIANNYISFNLHNAGGATTQSEVIRFLGNGNVGIGTTAPDKALEINSATGANLRLTYNDSNGSAANYADFSVSSGGDLTIAPSGGDTSVTGTLSATGALSGTTITGTLATAAQPNITSVGTLTSVTSTGKILTTLISEQMRLNYDASNYMAATVTSLGDLVINPSGKDTNLNGNLIVTGNISGYLNNVYYAQFHISYWNMDSTASYYQVVGINDQLRVCGASVVIYKDDGSTVLPIERGGYWEYTESDDRFTIYRDTSGIFDSTDFDGTGEWRGRFTVFYTDTAARL